MRWICLVLLLGLGSVACSDSGDTTGPLQSERFVGMWSLQSVDGQSLPVETVIIDEDDEEITVRRHSVTLEVVADHYLPEADWVDSLTLTDGETVENFSMHNRLFGFVKGDSILFRLSDEDGDVGDVLYRFILNDPSMPVRYVLDEDDNDKPVLVSEVWSRN